VDDKCRRCANKLGALTAEVKADGWNLGVVRGPARLCTGCSLALATWILDGPRRKRPVPTAEPTMKVITR
jgi:hypothetical protein